MEVPLLLRLSVSWFSDCLARHSGRHFFQLSLSVGRFYSLSLIMIVLCDKRGNSQQITRLMVITMMVINRDDNDNHNDDNTNSSSNDNVKDKDRPYHYYRYYENKISKKTK